MRDAHYEEVVGVEPDANYREEWDWPEAITVEDPLHTSFEDDSFEVVSCFDGSRCDDYPALLTEMTRLSTKHLIFRPEGSRNSDLHEEMLRMFLEERLELVSHNPIQGWYQLTIPKGVN